MTSAELKELARLISLVDQQDDILTPAQTSLLANLADKLIWAYDDTLIENESLRQALTDKH